MVEKNSNHLIFIDNQGGNFLLANFLASKVYTNFFNKQTNLPTIIISRLEAFFLNTLQISRVKRVLLELNTEVSDDIRAANITASITPLSPGEDYKKVGMIMQC